VPVFSMRGFIEAIIRPAACYDSRPKGVFA
jgi:hypothetical protein